MIKNDPSAYIKRGAKVAKQTIPRPAAHDEDKTGMKDNNNLEPGDLLMIAAGEYSDLHYTGPFRVVKAMNRADVSARYVAEFKPDPARPLRRGPDPRDFIAWLAREGYIEDIPSAEWHVGSYGEFEG